MKIAFASDLHLEYQHTDRQFALDFPPDADVIVLAGDITCGLDAAEVALLLAMRFKTAEIVWIAGNNEFYEGSIDALTERYRSISASNERVHFLEDDAAILHGIRFLGCTLWSDFSLTGDQVAAKAFAVAGIPDFRLIRTATGQNVTTDEAVDPFTESRAFLERELATGHANTTVVLTHFAPGLETHNPLFPVDAISSYFQANVTDRIGRYQPALWIYGHNHYSMDQQSGKTRLVSRLRVASLTLLVPLLNLALGYALKILSHFYFFNRKVRQLSDRPAWQV